MTVKSDVRRYVGKHGLKLNDSTWATQANRLGYDSIQIVRGADHMPELVITRSECLRQTGNIMRTCPPLELRTGERATLECRCSDRYAMLNCLNGVVPRTVP